MLLSTPGFVLHTTPYSESSVVAKVFTRQLGLRSYIIKGVRGPRGRVKQNLLQPLSCLDMVVYDSHRDNLNYIKELAPRHPVPEPDPVGNALRFFMTEVLYKAIREEEPLPELWDFVEHGEQCVEEGERSAEAPIAFMLGVAHHLGIDPMDNRSASEPLFDLQEGRFVGAPTDTTLSPALSEVLHSHLSILHSPLSTLHSPLSTPHSSQSRRDLLDALIAYFQMHLSGFSNFRSHEILHTILR